MLFISFEKDSNTHTETHRHSDKPCVGLCLKPHWPHLLHGLTVGGASKVELLSLLSTGLAIALNLAPIFMCVCVCVWHYHNCILHIDLALR